MSRPSHFEVAPAESKAIENIFIHSHLNFAPWAKNLPELHSIRQQFLASIREYSLRQTKLGKALKDFGARTTSSGWLTIGGLPDKVHPHVLLCLCSYLTGDIVEVPGAGPYITQVKDQPNAQSNRPSHANNLSFALHTDRSFLKEGRPEFQFLQAIASPSGYGGLSEVANVSDALAALNPKLAPKIIRTLCGEHFLFPAPPHHNPDGGEFVRGAILEPIPTNDGQHYIRFRQDGLSTTTDQAAEALNIFVSSLNKVKEQFLLEAGQILITDNWRALHGRTAVVPNPQHPRELNKAYVKTAPLT